ncbi:hypothetical protein DVT68_09670 [Dyella solisilvae]|uniref:Uncharacterized protein n=1 Tax=Dyella solisilvae TaxID=1920168 RepID=A0A370K7Z3_9GAMM|nr:flavin reductase [Dyella solisilvae]RDI98771.1 hypothetical protein DVT68_09670 [Dyella solisilvae]
MWKDWIRPWVRPLPQWSTIAVAPPQRVVSATLHWDGHSVDVTTDHTVASLKPLSIATSIDAGQRPTLEYRDSATGRPLGFLHLAKAAGVATNGAALAVYHVASGEHRCLDWPRRPWNTWLQNRLMRKTPSSHHGLMQPAAVQQLMIAYLCPRPVVLVSVATAGHCNIFPMDLIGPLGASGLYSLALRSTNVSAHVMREVRQVVLSNVPATMKAQVYQLSQHHKTPLTDWAALPFPVRPSKAFGIPAVSDALRIQELTIVDSQELGSHIFFLCHVETDQPAVDGAQLHHTPGFHQAYRRRRHMPFTEI